MHRLLMAVAAFLGMTATGLGAYGAHGLAKVAPPYLVESFNTAVSYQFFHCLLLMAVALWFRQWGGRILLVAGSLITAGILGFSGSIYSLVLLGTKGIGIITPIGGSLLILGWFTLLVAAWQWERDR
ncbi:DUF423 domain-containing protein [Ferrimonas aestuarii]|uniref:DUF423 domain-containing protein n=1 Tax=Ferrimonas aestuarii TaxID=2569539 RepID=A0A4U1BQ78_9GAMM|nr:DUF423 domain-containing protein [Ferrimonas aestuarii]TKB54802.1 DUF423 domain-containing protein [Ferrimonas aestuarii]